MDSPAAATVPPYKAKAIANYFLERAEKDGINLTQMKLQKLIYFAHGWHLALVGGPLIDERVQAWEFGPVIRTVYDEFKGEGRGVLKERATSIEVEGKKIRFFEPGLSKTDHQTRELLDRVWEVYKGFSAYQLSTMTHKAGSPWDKTYSKYPGVRNLTIDDDLIKEFFERIANGNRAAEATA